MSMKPNIFFSKDKDGKTVIDDQSIWRAAQTNLVNLNNWNIIEYKNNKHFIGNDMDRYGARLSTAIQNFNIKEKRGDTASGTIYQLHGNPGLDPDGHYLASRYFGKNIKFKF